MVRFWFAAACLAGGLCFPAVAEVPRRVLSMNVCTDQLAMMLAAPGQLISVSFLARDPAISVMADEAAALPVNHGLAEEIFLMQPDLVLAGRYTTPTTVRLLQRLDLPVEIFEPENDMQGIRDNISRMGELLGRETEARALVARFDADLKAVQDAQVTRPRAALYQANGYSSGENSLAGQIIAAAGFDNAATGAGLPAGGFLPLEMLMLAAPDLVILGRRYEGASRAEEVLDHPGLRALTERSPSQVVSDRDWVCGTPFVLRAVAELRDARRAWAQ